MQDTERIRIEKSDEKIRLTLKKVMRQDDGEYSCRLVNSAGETTGYTNLFVRQPVELVVLTVYLPPSLHMLFAFYYTPSLSPNQIKVICQ